MKQQRLLALFITALMAISLTGCMKDKTDDDFVSDNVEEMKIGFILAGDENSIYDRNFIKAIENAQHELAFSEQQMIIKKYVSENDDCFDAAKELAQEGCEAVFANSAGFEPYMLKAAKEFPDVQFCQIAGVRAHTEKLPNYHNAFASVYNGHYLTGIAAGMKLNSMILDGSIGVPETKIGFVGTYSCAEVISEYTAFFLGVRSVCKNA